MPATSVLLSFPNTSGPFLCDMLPGVQKPWVMIANLRDGLNLNDAPENVSQCYSVILNVQGRRK